MGCRGENNTSRAVGGASWLRAGRQVGEIYAMYSRQMMGGCKEPLDNCGE